MWSDCDKASAEYIRGKQPTRYQKAMNDASATLCLATPDLLDDRNTLLKQSRELVHNQGYA